LAWSQVNNTNGSIYYWLNLSADNLMLQVVSPRIWLPSMQIVWGVLTFCTSAVHNVQQVTDLSHHFAKHCRSRCLFSPLLQFRFMPSDSFRAWQKRLASLVHILF
jgi:hypothetical protein